MGESHNNFSAARALFRRSVGSATQAGWLVGAEFFPNVKLSSSPDAKSNTGSVGGQPISASDGGATYG